MSDNQNGWVKDEDTSAWYYYNQNGENVKGWNRIDGNLYYFNYPGGSMTWDNTIDGFYLENSGKMVNGTGWLQDGLTEDWYYFSDGEPATGWQNLDGEWYYIDNCGRMVTGWFQDENGDWYYLHSDGTMATGWVEDKGKWYFLYNNGSMAHDKTFDGYHVDKSGKMVTGTGWVYSDGSWYYLKDDGEVATDWLYNQGNWYYLYPEESMAKTTTINGWEVDNTGKWITDEEYIGDNITNKVTDGAAVTVTYDGTELPEDNFTVNSIVKRIANGTVVRTFKNINEFFKYQLLMGMGETNGEEGVIYVTDEQEKLADAGSDMLTMELGGDFVAIVANGVRAYKNIKTGEIIYSESYVAGSGAGNIEKAVGNAKWKEIAKELTDKATDVSSWNKGSFNSAQDSLAYHFDKHASEVGANSIEQYMRKAEGFMQNLRGAKKYRVDGVVEGTTRYVKNEKYIDVAPDGTIISFGKR